MSHLPYQYHALMCTQSRPPGHPRGCCTSRGGGAKLFERLAAKFSEKNLWESGKISIASTSCLGFCGYGPLMVIYPQGVWYQVNSEADIDEIVESHFINDTPVERLIVKPEKKK